VNTVGQESPTQASKVSSSEKSDDSGLNGSAEHNNAAEATNDGGAIKTPETNGVITDMQWPIEKNPSSASPSSGFSDDDSLTGVADGEGKTILQVVEMVKQKGKKGLIREYAVIRSKQPDGNFENARMGHNVSRNRYTDVLCFDHSRVILSQSLHEENSDEQSSDYINANFGNYFQFELLCDVYVMD